MVEDQKEYLGSILNRAKQAGESLRFSYELTGEDGYTKLFVLEINGTCYIRLAKREDVIDKLDPATIAAIRHKQRMIKRGLGPPEAVPTFEVDTGKSLNELTVDDLFAALNSFVVYAVMDS